MLSVTHPGEEREHDDERATAGATTGEQLWPSARVSAIARAPATTAVRTSSQGHGSGWLGGWRFEVDCGDLDTMGLLLA